MALEEDVRQLRHEIGTLRKKVERLSSRTHGNPDGPGGQHDEVVARLSGGEYEGDGASSREVDIGFIPAAVFVHSIDDVATDNAHWGMTISGLKGMWIDGNAGPDDQEAGESTLPRLSENGFTVGTSVNANLTTINILNESGVTYRWMALANSHENAGAV